MYIIEFILLFFLKGETLLFTFHRDGAIDQLVSFGWAFQPIVGQFGCFRVCESHLVLGCSLVVFRVRHILQFSFALRYSSGIKVGDVRNFAALRSGYVVAALRGVSSAWSVNVPVEGSKGQHVERLLAQTKKDFDSAIRFLSHMSGEKSDLVGMDLAAVDWPTIWSKLLHGACSMNTSSFTARTASQWEAFRASEVAKLMKQKVDQLKKLARPYLVKLERLLKIAKRTSAEAPVMMKQLQQTLPLPHRLDSQFLSSGVSELVSSRVACNLLRFTGLQSSL